MSELPLWGLKEEVTRKKKVYKKRKESRGGVWGGGAGYSSDRLYRPCCSNRLGYPFPL